MKLLRKDIKPGDTHTPCPFVCCLGTFHTSLSYWGANYYYYTADPRWGPGEEQMLGTEEHQLRKNLDLLTQVLQVNFNPRPGEMAAG